MLRPLTHRLRPFPLLWSVLSAALFVLGFQLGWPSLWQGVLLTIPLLIATTGLGWQAGVTLIPIGLGLVWINDRLAGQLEPWWLYAGLAAFMLLGVIGGQSLFRLWHDAERRARRNERRAKLLSEAALELQQYSTPQQIFAALPRMLANILEFTHATVLLPNDDHLVPSAAIGWQVPEGFVVPLRSISGRALASHDWQYVTDTNEDNAFVRAPNAPRTRSELAIPLRVGNSRHREQKQVVAILNIEHVRADAFDAEDRTTLQAFARIAEESLMRLEAVRQLEQRVSEEAFTGQLNRRLLGAETAEQVAEVVLTTICSSLAIDNGAVLVLQAGRFLPLAASGTMPAGAQQLLAKGLPWQRGQLFRSWKERQVRFIADYQQFDEADPDYRALGLRAVAFLPVFDTQGEVQALLEVGSFQRPRDWSEQDKKLLSIAANALGIALERATVNRQFVAMLGVIRSLAQAEDPSDLYQQAARAAVQLIPGAEAASILLRQSDGFHFVAAEGFDLAALQQVPPMSELDQMVWYGQSENDYRSGVPRLLRGNAIVTTSSAAAGKSASQLAADDAGRVHDLKANICIPIAYQREVVGILNVDSLTREDAFGKSALRLAEAFAQQVAVIIRQTLYRRALEQTVVTDPLTGLGNREGFNRQLQRELSRAKRYGHPLNLVMIDLDGFKRINDTLGHQQGDAALIAVAEAMRKQQRQGDSLFRWGGDEFALILPQVGPREAAVAAERYARAIAEIEIGPYRLKASIGIASYPADGEDDETLLRKADDLMYRHKQT